MLFGGWNLNTPLEIRAARSLAIASVHKVSLLDLSKSIAFRVLRDMLIPKSSLTSVLSFFFKTTFPLDIFGVTANFGPVNPQ